MNARQRLKADIAGLFDEQYFAVLATRAGDQIHTTLVAFAATDDLKTIFVCTPRATRKYDNLKQHPTVSLLVHNSANQPTDTRRSIAVTVSGSAGEVRDTQLADARAVYLARQPHMAEFAASPDTAVVEITVSRYDVVARFQEVATLDIQKDRIIAPRTISPGEPARTR